MNLFLLLFSFFSVHLGQQPDSVRFGVNWEIPSTSITAQKELRLFQKFGIKDVLIKGIIPLDYMDILNLYDFDVHVLITNKFITFADFEKNDQFLDDQLFDYYYYYKPFEKVKSIGLFEFGQVYNPNFASTLSLKKQALKNDINLPFFYIHQQSKIDLLQNQDILKFIYVKPSDLDTLKSDSHAQAFLFSSTENLSSKNFQQLVYLANGKTIFFNSSLILNEANESNLNAWMTAFLLDHTTLLDLEFEQEVENHPTYLVLIFLTCMLVFGLQFFIDPNFRKSVSRYYFAHAFFASDILDNRVRFGFTLVINLFMQAILAGMITLLLYKYILSDLGLESISFNYPYIDFWTTNSVTQFFFGFAHYIVVTLIQIVWLFLSFKDFKSISQPTTLILWPQIFNLFVSIILVNAFFNEVSGFWIIVFSLIYISVFLGSFYLATKDVFTSGRNVFFKDHFKTTIAYSVFLLFILIYWFNSIGLYDYLGLAYRLN